MKSTVKYTHKVLFTLLAMLSVNSTAEIKNDASVNFSPTYDCVIKPSDVIDLGAPVSGIIEQIYYDRSDSIKKGDHLVQIDARVEQMDTHLASKKAETNTSVKLRDTIVQLGYKTQKRSYDLIDNSLIPLHEIDKINNDVRIAELNLELEKENKELAEMSYERSLAILDRRSIVSKIDGVVVERYKSIGERVNDDPILRIAKLDPLHIEAAIPLDYYSKIQEGMKATISPLMGTTDTYTATVSVIDKIMDAASGTFGVRLSLSNPDYKIPAGILCQLNFSQVE